MPRPPRDRPPEARGAVASAIFILVCAPVYSLLAWGSVLLVPGSFRPALLPPVVAAGFAVLVVGGVAALSQRRTRRAPAWWSVWATAVTSLAAVSLVDPQMQQVVAMSLVVAPMYTAMFMSVRATLAQLLLTAVCSGLLSAAPAGAPELRVMRAGVTVGVVMTVVVGLLVLRARLDGALARADHLALHDPLTGLLNRRGLQQCFPALVESARRSGATVCLVLADLDHFKEVNDTQGHDAGDRLLVDVAAALGGAARSGDLVVRLGGEELLLAALVTGPSDVAVLAERVRGLVAGVRAAAPVTASVGAVGAGGAVGAVGARAGLDPDALLSTMLLRADELMYEAKAGGRDRSAVDPALVGAARG